MQTTNWNSWGDRMYSIYIPLSESITAPLSKGAMEYGFESFLHVLFDMEKAYRSESEYATKTYIEFGRWIDQSASAAYITMLRTQCAVDFCAQLCSNDYSGFDLPNAGEETDAVVLSWLLIDHWNRCHDFWLKLVGVSVFYHLPLYGMDPAPWS